MKNKVCADKKKRNLNLQFENKRYVLKSLSKSNKVNKIIKWNSMLKFTGQIYKGNQFVSRCIFSGQKKKFNKSFNISRLFFLKSARNGVLPGIKKSTW